MLKNKIMAVSIGLLLLTTTANTQTLRTDKGPAERPPASYKGKQYVDSRGCVYIRAGQGGAVTWVPRVNRSRNVFCSKRNKPSLSATQLATISGKPATRVKTPVVKAEPVKKPVQIVKTPVVPKPVPQKTPKQVTTFNNSVPAAKPVTKVTKPKQIVQQKPKVIPQAVAPNTVVAQKPVVRQQTRKITTGQAKGVRLGPQAVHPADEIFRSRTDIAVAQPAQGVVQRPIKTVRGHSPAQRRANRNLAFRNGPQAVHPADEIKAYRAQAAQKRSSGSKKKAISVNRVDPVHNLTVYNTVIGSDVTARGDAQMNLIWTNTVPRRLVNNSRAKDVATRTASWKSTKGIFR